jgi:hypothetical protein
MTIGHLRGTTGRRLLGRLLLPWCLLASACGCPRGGSPDSGSNGCPSLGPCGLCANPDSGYQCVTDSGTQHCAPIASTTDCFFQTCVPGEVCSAGQCQCTPTAAESDGGLLTDTCMPYGMTCDVDTGRCLLPGELQWCTQLGGCQPGLDCVPVTPASAGLPDGGSFTFDVYRCAKQCTTDSDCTNPRTTCITGDPTQFPCGLINHCGWNLCPTDSTTNEQIYFQSCDTTVAPSTCIPYTEPAFELGAGAYFSQPVGFCVVNGSAPASADCDPNGSVVNLSTLCPAGQVCVPVGYDGGTCLTACNFGTDTTQGTPCPGAGTTTECVNASGVNFQCAPSVQLGACFNICNIFSTQSECPSNPSGRAFGCQVNPSTGDLSSGLGDCLPTQPNAPGVGGACVSNTNDLVTAIDWPCADRTYCSSEFDFFNTGAATTGICMPYCTFTSCPPDQACQATCPIGSVCIGVGVSDAGPQEETGFCLPNGDGGIVVDAGIPSDAGASDSGTSDGGAAD